jgi:hypothetical protein
LFLKFSQRENFTLNVFREGLPIRQGDYRQTKARREIGGLFVFAFILALSFRLP